MCYYLQHSNNVLMAAGACTPTVLAVKLALPWTLIIFPHEQGPMGTLYVDILWFSSSWAWLAM